MLLQLTVDALARGQGLKGHNAIEDVRFLGYGGMYVFRVGGDVPFAFLHRKDGGRYELRSGETICA